MTPSASSLPSSQRRANSRRASYLLHRKPSILDGAATRCFDQYLTDTPCYPRSFREQKAHEQQRPAHAAGSSADSTKPTQAPRVHGPAEEAPHLRPAGPSGHHSADCRHDLREQTRRGRPLRFGVFDLHYRRR